MAAPTATVVANMTMTSASPSPMTDCQKVRPKTSTTTTRSSTRDSTALIGASTLFDEPNTETSCGCRTGSNMNPLASSSNIAAAEAVCHCAGQVAHGRAYHGRSAAVRTASITAGSNVLGARGAGSSFNARSTLCSSSEFIVRHVLFQGLAAPVDVRLDLAK